MEQVILDFFNRILNWTEEISEKLDTIIEKLDDKSDYV